MEMANKRRLLFFLVLFLSSSSLFFFFSEGSSSEEEAKGAMVVEHEWVAPEDGTVTPAMMLKSTEVEAKSDLDETFRENPETLSQLFDWAIQNSDRETLRSMAEEMRKREMLGDGDDEENKNIKRKKNYQK